MYLWLYYRLRNGRCGVTTGELRVLNYLIENTYLEEKATNGIFSSFPPPDFLLLGSGHGQFQRVFVYCFTTLFVFWMLLHIKFHHDPGVDFQHA